MLSKHWSTCVVLKSDLLISPHTKSCQIAFQVHTNFILTMSATHLKQQINFSSSPDSLLAWTSVKTTTLLHLLHLQSTAFHLTVPANIPSILPFTWRKPKASAFKFIFLANQYSTMVSRSFVGAAPFSSPYSFICLIFSLRSPPPPRFSYKWCWLWSHFPWTSEKILVTFP